MLHPADTKALEFEEAFAMKPAFDGERICHPISGFVLNCMVNELFINCPANIWKSSEYRRRLKMSSKL